MSAKQLKVSFGDINDKNINVLRKINFSVFPVKYSTPFYLKVAMEYASMSKFCFFNDMVIGAYTVRVEDYKEQRHAYILTFGVLEPYRKHKVGYQMMEELENMVKHKTNAVAIYLHMHVINEVGKKFYERCGFVVDQRIDNYYTDLEEPHCYILRKVLNRDKADGAVTHAA